MREETQVEIGWREKASTAQVKISPGNQKSYNHAQPILNRLPDLLFNVFSG